MYGGVKQRLERKQGSFDVPLQHVAEREGRSRLIGCSLAFGLHIFNPLDCQQPRHESLQFQEDSRRAQRQGYSLIHSLIHYFRLSFKLTITFNRF